MKLDLKRKKHAQSLPLRTGTWNVRTLQTGLDNLDRSHGHIRKTAVIDRELSLLNVDIVALQETCIAVSGSLRGKLYFFLKRPNADQHRLYGVGFAIRNSPVWSISTPTGISERIVSPNHKT